MADHPATTRRGAAPFAVLIALVLVAVGACTSGGPASPAAALTVSNAWVRVPGGVDQPAAGYLTITNTGTSADALVSASSPGAASVGIHQTTMDSGGMMGMQPVASVGCPIGATVSLAPGGYHLMIIGLKGLLKVGDRLELDLVFAHTGRIVVQAEVRQG